MMTIDEFLKQLESLEPEERDIQAKLDALKAFSAVLNRSPSPTLQDQQSSLDAFKEKFPELKNFNSQLLTQDKVDSLKSTIEKVFLKFQIYQLEQTISQHKHALETWVPWAREWSHRAEVEQSLKRAQEQLHDCYRQRLKLSSPNHPVRLATLFIEKNDPLGFKVTEYEPSADESEAQTTGASITQQKVEFLGVAHDTTAENKPKPIQSIRAKSATEPELVVVQDKDGQVFDRSPTGPESKITVSDEEILAIKMAKMFLLNYEPSRGPILITGAPEQRQRIYVALVVLAKQAGIPLKRSDICADWAKEQGMFESVSTYTQRYFKEQSGVLLGTSVQELSDKQARYKKATQYLGQDAKLHEGTVLSADEPSRKGPKQ